MNYLIQACFFVFLSVGFVIFENINAAVRIILTWAKTRNRWYIAIILKFVIKMKSFFNRCTRSFNLNPKDRAWTMFVKGMRKARTCVVLSCAAAVSVVMLFAGSFIISNNLRRTSFCILLSSIVPWMDTLSCNINNQELFYRHYWKKKKSVSKRTYVNAISCMKKKYSNSLL